ncbi:Glycerol-3-phosphate regulon repressor [Corynebacterium kutscheri]|uniref:Lactose phosphotransferase system repressor n=1 Tax=Corynebacterium kutscheri TaxID=35755 RepID=A0AB38VT45_9CORY|nr:DeoR/GlpR family DNA-binding transcription regulator [Corynebacterium kutscheri]VEH08672.1 Glycerol-3-phosphate regulon repressor [Corynebacterium kutscheri]VEH79802.1 Glycerol-3-phosphate regulon repressor [Corynebacterium kutscheri]
MATLAEVSDRQTTIVAITEQLGRCSVAHLAQQFDVTPETIRRDLKQLETQGLLRRVHGGAVIGGGTSPSDLLAVDEVNDLPIHQSQRRKQAIAQAALELIPSPCASIFIDAGSTTEAFANTLARHYVGQSWVVVTNSPNIARSLATAGVPSVSIVGGIVKARTQAIVGPQATEALKNLRADIAFLGTTGLSIDRGLTTSDPREADMKTAMLHQSNISVALCDSTKIGKDSVETFAALNDLNFIVTDKNISQSNIDSLRNFDPELVIP